MESILVFLDFADRLNLSSFSSLFEVFLPAGFVIFAAKKALPWVINLYINYNTAKEQLTTLVNDIEKKNKFDESQSDPESNIRYQKNIDLLGKVSEKREAISKKEENIYSASRIDFLQLGLFTFAMLIFGGIEETIILADHVKIFTYLLLIINVISLIIYIYRHLTFNIDGNGYSFINEGIVHFPLLMKKTVSYSVFFIISCGTFCTCCNFDLLLINKVFIIGLSIINLVLPFIFLYLRSKTFDSSIQNSKTIAFVAQKKEEFNQANSNPSS